MQHHRQAQRAELSHPHRPARGGIIFVIGLWIWSAFFGFQYPWLLAAVTLAAGVSFVDDIHSLPDSVRLVAQFLAMGMMFWQLDMIHPSLWWAGKHPMKDVY